jgi:hypothetical protein
LIITQLISFTSFSSLSDTIVFDISQATYSSFNNVNFIEIPVQLSAGNNPVNSFDFWFQFDLSKLSYISTTSLMSGLDAFSNFNSTNLYLSNTTSGTSINYLIPSNTNLLILKFIVLGSCTEITSNDFYNTSNIIGNNLAYLDSMKSYLATMQMSLSPLNSFNFNRKTNRIRFNEPLSLLKEKTSNIVLKIYKKLDINTFNDIWADEFLKEYATALIKRQWGENLKKFGNMNLPGGITINGDAIYSESITEIEKLETRLTRDLQLPLDLFIG